MGGGSGSIAIYDLLHPIHDDDEALIAPSLTILRNTRSSAPVTCCAFSKNGDQLLATSRDCSLWRWEVTTIASESSVSGGSKKMKTMNENIPSVPDTIAEE